jgi:hypothetical protein
MYHVAVAWPLAVVFFWQRKEFIFESDVHLADSH